MKVQRAGNTGRQRWRVFAILLVCFFLSGATALVCEVVWLRMLGLVFGHTVYAITTVVAAFMAGLGLGSFLFGRRAVMFRDPIRIYGILEIGVGMSCALVPGLIWLASFLYLDLFRVLAWSYATFSFVQFLVVFALLLVPTTLMGGTLPILSQTLVPRTEGIGSMVGTLYAVNTFGGVAGAAAAGYGLLPALGNRNTLWFAVLVNVAVGVSVLACARWMRGTAAERSEAGRHRRGSTAPAAVASVEPLGLAEWLTVAALGVSGAVSMVYEVAWTRALSLVIGSSTYAFTAMLVAFLVGIGGGAAVYAVVWRRRHATPGVFATLQCGIGVAATLVLLTFDRLPELFLVALGRSDSPSFVEVGQLAVSGLALLPSTLLIGATFPCAVAACARAPGRAGEEVGWLYAVNTWGAIAGAVLAGFVLVPALGVQGSIKAGIVTNLVLAAVPCVARPRGLRGWPGGRLGVSLLVAAGVAFAPSWDERVMSSGPAIYGKTYLQAKSLNTVLHPVEILFHRDGPSATVSVTSVDGILSLRVNGKVDASTNPKDMPTQLMLGHAPLLAHPDPRTVLVIGLGSGMTAGAVARYPVERLDVVEIEPAVVEASRHFAAANGHVLDDSRVRLVIADARNFLLTTPERYDVITSEPSNPWIGGIASLFTREFFELARQRLGPGGIMVQWVHAYSLFPEDFRMIVKTFRTVFPAASIWQVTVGDYLLLGRLEPVTLDLAQVKARYRANPAIRHDLERIGVRDWPGILGYFMLGEADVVRYSEGALVNTDDLLPLEFSAPRALYVDTVVPNWRLMHGFKATEFPDLTPASRSEVESAQARYSIGMVHLGRGVPEYALSQFRRAIQLDPNFTPALLESGKMLLAEGLPSEALALAQRVLSREPLNMEALFLAGLASHALGGRP